MSPAAAKPVSSQGLRQLLSQDPAQHLLYAVEQAAPSAHPLRMARVLRRLRRRPERIGWFHASEIADPERCSRYLAARLLGYRFREDVGVQLQRIFDNGTYMHFRWQNYFLSLPPRFSVQVGVEFQRYPILGEADVLVDHPELGRIIVELKSIREDGFRALKGKPQAAHARQTNMYIGLDGFRARGQVWYENKNNQEVAALTLRRRDRKVYERAHERALGLVELVSAGRLPPPCDPPCAYDERVGRLEIDERRWATLREEALAHAA